MLRIRRDPATGRAVFDTEKPSPTTQRADLDLRPDPTPRITQPWVLSFREWCDRYAYFIDTIATCMHGRMMHIHDPRTVNMDGMRNALERHLYRTSANRYRKFVLLK